MKYDLFVPKKARQAMLVIFYYGGMINAIVFMFLYLSLVNGYNPIEKIMTFFS